MKGKVILLLSVAGVVAGAAFISACADDGNQADATGDTAVATPTMISAAKREMLKGMIPDAVDVPGFVIADARFLGNEGAGAQARDPSARLAGLEEMGRVVGFRAVLNRSDNAPPGAPSSILWSVDLFQQPSGALDLVSQQPEVAQGFAHEPLDVGTLGPGAVGWALRSLLFDEAASAYSVAFAEGVIQVSLTALYEEEGVPPDYTLNLAQQARAMVRTALGSPPGPPSPQAGGSVPAPPTATPTGLMTVPARAQVGSP